MWLWVLGGVSVLLVGGIALASYVRKRALLSTRRTLAELQSDVEYNEKSAELKAQEVLQAGGFRDDPGALSDFINDLVGESGPD